MDCCKQTSCCKNKNNNQNKRTSRGYQYFVKIKIVRKLCSPAEQSLLETEYFFSVMAFVSFGVSVLSMFDLSDAASSCCSYLTICNTYHTI